MKITLIVHNLSMNPIVRVYPIALSLRKIGYEVDIVGFTIGKNKIYNPYKNLNIKSIHIENGLLSFLFGFKKLLKLVKGDIVYCFKPLLTTYLVGLVKTFCSKKHLLLDVEDNEMYFEYKNKLDFIFQIIFRGWNNPNSHKNLFFLHFFLWPCKFITVSSSKLKKKYNGKIILHGPSEELFNPKLYNKSKSKKKFNLPFDKKILLFAGVPHKHKGLNFLVKALNKIEKDFLLLLVGEDINNSFFNSKKILGNKCKILNSIPNSEMPHLLSAVDIVVALQLKNSFTECQIPAKILEAMAMGKIVISTDISDIGYILGKNSNSNRGFVVKEDDIDGLINTLINIIEDKFDLSLIKSNARDFFIKNASVEINSKKISKLLNNIK